MVYKCISSHYPDPGRIGNLKCCPNKEVQGKNSHREFPSTSPGKIQFACHHYPFFLCNIFKYVIVIIHHVFIPWIGKICAHTSF